MEQSKLPADLQKKVDDCVQYCHDKLNHLLPHIAIRPALEAWAQKYAALQAKCERMERALKEIKDGNCDYENVNYKLLHSTECKRCKADQPLIDNIALAGDGEKESPKFPLKELTAEQLGVMNKTTAQQFTKLTPEQVEERRKARNPAVHEVDPDYPLAHEYAAHIEKTLTNGHYTSALLGYQQGMHDTLIEQSGIWRARALAAEKALGERVRWVKASDKRPEGWQLARLIDSGKRFPAMFSTHVIAGIDGKTYRPEEVEWLDESAAGREEVGPQELWDEHAEYIDDNIDELVRWAGSTVITWEQFNKMMAKFKQQKS